VKIRVLVVEDNDDDVFLMKRTLEKMTVEAVYVPTVETAIRALRDEPKFHVVLLDLHLPDATGLQAVRRIAPYHDTIVVMTGDPDQDEYDAIREGADDFLVKGADTATIRRTINVAIERTLRWTPRVKSKPPA